MSVPRYPRNAAFIEARHYLDVPGANLPCRWITIHDMEMPEEPDTAEGCAQMFAGKGSPIASCHFMVDSDSVVQGVDIDKIAYHAPPNTGSVGIEHAGYAKQTRQQWMDPFGLAMIEQSAALCAWLCVTCDIPAVWRTPAQLQQGVPGLRTHADVATAFRRTDHRDPGPAFPKDYYLQRVLAYLTGDTEETMPTADEIARAVWNQPNPSGELGSDKKPVTMQYILMRTYQATGRVEAKLDALAESAAKGDKTLAARLDEIKAITTEAEDHADDLLDLAHEEARRDAERDARDHPPAPPAPPAP
jgi:N-acetyl-anhydromuramyl-L-alanine amidase AmpD